MKFDFDEMTTRRGTNAVKWDLAKDPDVLPMWVADMDFPTAPAIIEALEKRVKHGIFGYTKVPSEYYDAVVNWFKRRHLWSINPDWIVYTSGVVPAVSAILKALTMPGDKVLMQTPVYNCFYSCIHNSGCQVASSPLIPDGDTYRMDFEDLERKAKDERVKVMLLCSPHNPAGRVWTKDELTRVGEICLKHGVTVLSDEIHCELVYDGHIHIPFASLSDEFSKHSVTCVSPSKAFNIAGLQIANIVCENDEMRRRIDRAINLNEVCDVNPFGVLATIAAYNNGEEWLEQLLDYINGNYLFMKKYCAEHLPQFPLAKLEGTYLVWMDCRTLNTPTHELEERLIDEAKLWLNAGKMYGDEGEGFMRWNIACQRTRLIDGLERFRKYVEKNSH